MISVGVGVNVRRRSTISVALVMPTGAAVLFYPADANTATPMVRNRAVATAVADNMMGSPRPSLNPYGWGIGNAITRTLNVAGPDATLNAVGFAYTAGGSAYYEVMGPRFLTSGVQYTIAWDIISNTAAVNILMGNGATALSGVKAVTTAWTRISHTFTAATTGFQSLSIIPSAAAAFDVKVDNVYLGLGATEGALTGNELQLHARKKPNMLGNLIEANKSTLDARMAYKFTNQDRNQANPNQTAISFVVALKVEPTYDDTAIGVSYIANESETFGNELNNNNGGMTFGISSSTFGLAGVTGGLSTRCAGPAKAGWIVVSVTAGPAGTHLFMNGLKINSIATAYGAPFGGVEFMGLRNSISSGLPGKFAFMGMWLRQLTDAEVATVVSLATAEITAAGEVLTDFGTVLVGDGDSITQFDSGTSLGIISRVSRSYTTRLQSTVFAIAGSNIANLQEAVRKAATKAKIAEVLASGRRVIYTVLLGANWQGSTTAAIHYAAIKAYTDEIKAMGANVRIIVQTMTAVNGTAGVSGSTPFSVHPNQAIMDSYNQMLRDGVTAGDFHAVADHAVTLMSPWSATYYDDQVHLSVAGNVLAAATLATAVSPWII